MHTLYLAYKGEHLHVYENTATAVIANVACNYSAYTFFNDKQGIAAVMQTVLAEAFEEKLFAQAPRPPPLPSRPLPPAGCPQPLPPRLTSHPGDSPPAPARCRVRVPPVVAPSDAA